MTIRLFFQLLLPECHSAKSACYVILSYTAEKRAVYDKYGKEGLKGTFSFGDYTRKNLTTCSKSANKPSTSCVRTVCYKLSASL